MRNTLLILLLLLSQVAFADPCSNIQTITCGSNVSFTFSGAGDAAWPNGMNGQGCYNNSGSGGQEKVFQFTAPQTGYYQFQVIMTNGGYVDYYWKDITFGGCNNTQWNCINYTNGAGHIGAISLTANQVIYILANAESTNATSQTFQLKCANNVCDSIQTVTCGTPIGFSSTGYGGQDYPKNISGSGCYNGSNAQGGQERIYKFKASHTGYYQLQVTAASGGYVDYYWKDTVSGNCTNSQWNCINYTNGAGHIGAISLAANQVIYILANAESPGNINHTFQLICANNVCDSIQTVTCGTPIGFSSTGYGGQDYPKNISGSGCYNGSNAQGGQEWIYKFKATHTGYYQLQVTAASGGYVDYYWKDTVSGNCTNSQWNCINYTNGAGHIGAISLAANQVIYILANAESPGNINHTFQLICANNVCDSIQTVTCGTPIGFSSTGYGGQDYPKNITGSGCYNGSNAQGGQERIYLLPPAASYQIQILTAAGYVDYYWKYASQGCGNTGWTCIGYRNTAGMLNLFSPTGGGSILLLANAESAASTNHTFTVNCNSNCTTLPTPGAPNSITASQSNICSGSTTVLKVNGTLSTQAFWKWYAGTCGGVASGTGDSIFVYPNATTSYYVRAENACGNSTCVPFTVNVTGSVTPSLAISSSATTITQGQSVTFTATPVNGGTAPVYEWRINGIVVAGQTQATFTTSTLSNGDVVCCKMTSNAACVTSDIASSNCITMSVITHVNDVTSSPRIHIYPNPSAGNFVVHVSSSVSEPLSLSVANIFGQKVFESSGSTGNDLTIKINKPAGIYFVEIITSSGKHREKIIIQ